MAAIPPIRINPEASVRREPIADHAFCIVVDDFLQDPGSLVEFAAAQRSAFAHPNVGYPGVQLRVNDDAMKDVFRFVRSKMSKQYGFMRARIGIRSLLSMVTWPPEALDFMQRICHIDHNPDPNRATFGGLVYLFHDERLGGTSFYRWKDEDHVWKALGMLREDAAQGEAFLRERYETFREPPRYMTDSNEIAERLHTVPPRFNRFVFYPGDLPHSASIDAPDRLSDDPRTGRLTLNLFFSVLPAAGLVRAT